MKIHRRSDLLEVQSINFPRVGHHFLSFMLREYFDCAWSYCEYYSDCGQVPCENNALFAKNHDLNLKFPRELNKSYLIMYRDPLPCLQSWFLLHVKNRTLDMTRENWELFFEEQLKFWRLWMQRWIINYDLDKQVEAANGKKYTRLRVEYDELLKFPKETLMDVIKLFGVEEPHEDKVVAIAKGYNFNYPRVVKNFPFYSDYHQVAANEACEMLLG